jgi:hypothetical protein
MLKKESKEIDFVIKSEIWSAEDLADFRILIKKLKKKNNPLKKSKPREKSPI